MIPSSTLTPRQQTEAQERIKRWAQVLSKVNYGIKGGAVPTVVHDYGFGAPAMTDGKSITFNGPDVVGIFNRVGNNRGVTNLLGLNYHELSHIFYSPSPSDSSLVVRLKYRAKERNISDGEMFGLCNMVEDQRIETLFATKYKQAANYFTVLLHDRIVGPALGELKSRIDKGYSSADPAREAARVYFLYTVGRAYLPVELRAEARADFVKHYGPSVADQITKIVRRYCRMNLMESTAVQKRAGDAIAELWDVMRDNGLTTPPDQTGHNSDRPGTEGNPGPAKDGQPETDEERRKREENAKTSKEAGEAYDDADDEDAESDSEAGGSAAEPADDADEADEDGDGGAGAGGDDAESDADDEGEAAAGGGEGAQSGESDEEAPAGEAGDGDSDGDGDTDTPTNGAGKSGTDVTMSDDLEDRIERMIEDVLNDDDLRDYNEELTQAVDATVEDTEVDWSSAKHRSRYDRPAQPDEITQKSSVTNALQRMKADTGSVWERRVDYGRRVNLPAFHQRQPWEIDFFDNYEEGAEDEFDMEVVILLDQSGSMSTLVASAEAALWSIRSAFSSVGARVWGIGYSSSNAAPLFTPNMGTKPTAVPHYGCGGGTNPEQALREARSIFKRSDAHSKVLLCITDGAWDGGAGDQMVQMINSDGVTTILAYLEHPGSYTIDLSYPVARHYCDIGRNVADPKELVTLMEDYIRHRAMSR